MARVFGSQLSEATQRAAKAMYVHRFTGEHRPEWAKRPMPNGKPYPLQFADDAEWLANTEFEVTQAGRLDRRYTYCHSHPTWPNNPELRRGG